MQEGLGLLRDAGIKLYAISYDDPEALAAFVAAAGIEYTMLSDADSRVIRQYGVLNTLVGPEDVPFHGIPFPGFFLVNEDGVIQDKLFNPHLANREGVETIVDRFLGRIEPGEDEPTAAFSEDDGIEVTAFLRGGGGVLRVGPRRRLVVRFKLPEGLHIYDGPVPTGMVATQIEVEGPEGIRFEPLEQPPTRPLELPGLDATLNVWDGTVDFVIPLFANSALASRFRDEDSPSIELKVDVRYQACDDAQCFIPRSESLRLEVPLAASPRPAFELMKGMGGVELDMDSEAHMRRLVARQKARAQREEKEEV